MGQFIKNLIKGCIVVFSFFISPKTLILVRRLGNSIYTFWYAGEFRSVGRRVSIASPLYLKGGEYITIGSDVEMDQRLRLDAIDDFLGEKFYPKISIGNNVSIQKDCHLGAIDKISIGNNVLIASKVYISDHFHGEITKEALLLPPAQRKLYSKGQVIIEDNVWLGEGVVVLPGVIIGENSIVGANAVVTKSVPKNCVVGGNPARIIKEIS